MAFNKHKISSGVVLLFIIALLGAVVAGLDSSDLDEVCNVDDTILYRLAGEWVCGSLEDVEINITQNNITYLINNYSLNANNSIYWNGLLNPIDAVNGTIWNRSGTRISTTNLDDGLDVGNSLGNGFVEIVAPSGNTKPLFVSGNKAGGTAGITFSNLGTTGSAIITLAETDSSSGATPFYIERVGSGNGATPNQVNIVNAQSGADITYQTTGTGLHNFTNGDIQLQDTAYLRLSSSQNRNGFKYTGGVVQMYGDSPTSTAYFSANGWWFNKIVKALNNMEVTGYVNATTEIVANESHIARNSSTGNMTITDSLHIDYSPATATIPPSLMIGEMTHKSGYASSMHTVGGWAMQRRVDTLNTYINSIWDAAGTTLLASNLISNAAGGNSFQTHCYGSNCLLRFYATGSSHREHMRVSEDDFIIFDDNTDEYPLWIEKDEHQIGIHRATPRVPLDINGETWIDGDLNVTNNITGNMIYGEIWFNNESSSGRETTISAPNTWTNISGFDQAGNDGGNELNGFTIHNSNSLNVIMDGIYKVGYSISFERLSGGVSREYEIGVSLSGVIQNKSVSHRTIGNANDVGDADQDFKLRLTTGDKIYLQVNNMGGSEGAGVHNAVLGLERLGD